MSDQEVDGAGLGELRLRSCLERLDEITREMGSDRIELEDALSLHAEGVELLERANEILTKAKLQVSRMTRGSEEG